MLYEYERNALIAANDSSVVEFLLVVVCSFFEASEWERDAEERTKLQRRFEVRIWELKYKTKKRPNEK